MTLAQGTRLGVYEITGALGVGGMGEVYRATDSKLGREVAIKTLPAALAADKDRLARFEREAKLLAALNHAHIGAIYGLDEHEGTLYIAMELVEGETLEEKLKQGALPVEDALRLALQIAEALEAAHDKGVVHRDLKPANVMVTREGQVKVLDFGLAKAFSGDPNEASPAHSPALSMAMTQQGLILGTAGYMSPEQASGQATDQRADVWAFGVLVYEMLTGLPLFSGESVPHILADVLRMQPDWNRLPKNLHPRLRLMLERCLEKRPRTRYHAIADARTDIEVVLSDPQGVIVRAGYDGAGGAVARPWPRKVLPWAAGIVLAAVAGVAAWTVKTPPQGQVIRSSMSLPEGQSFSFLGLRLIDIAPDGRQFVYNTNEGLDLRAMDRFESVLIPGVDFIRASPVFSPDGQSIAFIAGAAAGVQSGGGQIQIYRVSVTGGSARPLVVAGNRSTNVPQGLSWGPDRTLVYVLSDGIWRISDSGGMPEKIVETAPNERASAPSLLPGGDWVLFSLLRSGAPTVDWDTAEVVAQSLKSGERRTLYSGGSAPRYVPTGHLVFVFRSTLYALPFDVGAIKVAGEPIPVVEGVSSNSGGSGVAQYAFSKNGTLIYVPGEAAGSAGARLGIADRSGHVDSLPTPSGSYADARVSHDGRWVAYTATYSDGDDIAVYDLKSRAAPRRLTFGGQSRFPLWSVDSRRVAFQSTRDGTASLYWQVADGSGGDPVRLTTAAEGETHSPDSFSPDGKWLTFSDVDKNGSSVSILELATGETKVLLTQPGAAISQSVFSPDGHWLAYQSIETGLTDIFVQPFPLTGAKFQLPKTGDDHHPAWSPDGSELFYTWGPTGFQSVPITTKPRFSFGTATAVANNPMNDAPQRRRQFDVLPDGSGFIGAVPEGSNAAASKTIRIVYNWFDELERVVPRK
jgi:Tol biopolymer transport system component